MVLLDSIRFLAKSETRGFNFNSYSFVFVIVTPLLHFFTSLQLFIAVHLKVTPESIYFELVLSVHPKGATPLSGPSGPKNWGKDLF